MKRKTAITLLQVFGWGMLIVGMIIWCIAGVFAATYGIDLQPPAKESELVEISQQWQDSGTHLIWGGVFFIGLTWLAWVILPYAKENY